MHHSATGSALAGTCWLLLCSGKEAAHLCMVPHVGLRESEEHYAATKSHHVH